jgi:glycosyltransferase involved in cell wall biosynthesis
MQILHVVPHINQEASGPSYSVPRLCQSLAARGHQVELGCLGVTSTIPGITLNVHTQWTVPRRFAVSPGLAASLARNANVVDIVHNHSLWSMVNVAAGWVVPGRRAKLVVSPRGTLSTWALSRSRTVKGLLWPLQCRVLSRADLLHATSDDESREIRSLGFTAPICVIPNGIDIPTTVPTGPTKEDRILLFLSRIHPKKGIDQLLKAWKLLEHRHPTWRLVIAGQGEPKHVSEVTQLARTLSLSSVNFVGPLYGDHKSQAYSRAELFVLPTHSENFGMVVAEALAHGCPVVVSRGAPWSPVDCEGCGWWVSNDVESLSAALDNAMSLGRTELALKGAAGRAWMRRDYSWETVGERMAGAYQWLLGGGPPPPYVHLGHNG